MLRIVSAHRQVPPKSPELIQICTCHWLSPAELDEEPWSEACTGSSQQVGNTVFIKIQRRRTIGACKRQCPVGGNVDKHDVVAAAAASRIRPIGHSAVRHVNHKSIGVASSYQRHCRVPCVHGPAETPDDVNPGGITLHVRCNNVARV
jgi:hypothetical protein